MLVYPALFTQDGDYILVTFPDVPEAITQGKDVQEAFEKATEVLGFALEDYKEYPQPTSPSDLKQQFPDSYIALIQIDMVVYMKKYHANKVRKNVTIPEWLNDFAEENDVNFSQVLTEALERELQP